MIDSNSLTYTEYKDPRIGKIEGFEEGFSGPLLLGTDKKSGKRYIIKHAYAHNVTNEYVCCSLAEKLGIPAPRAYLLSPNERFSSKYGVAIEFLDGMKEVNKDGLTTQMMKDICLVYAFQYAFSQSDLVSIREWNNRVVTFDFSETFNMDRISFLIEILEQNPKAATEYLGHYLYGFRNSMAKNFDYSDVFERNFGIAPDFTIDVMNAFKKQLGEITDSDIYTICDELDLLFPTEISLYYEFAIQAVRDYWQKA